MNHPLSFSQLYIAIGFLLASNLAAAQSADAVDLDSVSVTGVRASIQQALVEKHSAAGIVDAISAEDIGKFPDLNLSESLQRIPGITLDRNNLGEGSAINLRGLGPEFTQVEINGMLGVSNGGQQRTSRTEGSRGFNFEMFASELFSKATVYKTGLAEVDEGGLAGTVRLETPRPLETRGTRFVSSVLGNYGELNGNIDPRAAVLFSHNQNNVFGVAASVAWSKTDFASNVAQASSWLPFARFNTGTRASDEERAALVPIDPLYYVFSEDRETTGATLTLQFNPNEQFNFTLDGMYGTLKNTRVQVRNEIGITSTSTRDRGIDAPMDYVIEDGIMRSGSFTGVRQIVSTRHHEVDEDYNQIVARMEWTPNEYWSIRPSLGYAKREAEREFAGYIFRLADSNGEWDPGSISYQVRGDFVDFSSSATDFASNPQDFLYSTTIVAPESNRDRQTQARVDFDRHFAGNDHVLKFGLRYNNRKMDRSAGQWQLQRAPGTAVTDLPSLERVYGMMDYSVAGFNAPPRLLIVDKQRFWDVYLPGGNPLPGTVRVDQPGLGIQETYTIEEKTGSAWMQADVQFEQWTLNPGVRYVRTEQISTGADVINADLPTQVITPVRVAKTYHGFLPSVSARYDVSRQVVLRASYARSLTRPNTLSLSPGEILTPQVARSGRRGNPYLEPYYANNFDLGAEWYFSDEGLLALNVFYKRIGNFIENRSFEEERTYPLAEGGGTETAILTISEPVNGYSTSIKGVEFSAQSRFYGLPGLWGNFGGILNYTHTDSSADFGLENDVRSQGLPGLSKNSVNATLYYDDGRFDARLAYAWRDRYLAQFVDLGGVPRFTKAYGQLDVSLSYRINQNLSAQFQILNLTEEQRIDQSSARYLPYAVSEIDRRFMVGLRMAF